MFRSKESISKYATVVTNVRLTEKTRIATATMHGLPFEIRRKWTLSVGTVLKGLVTVCTESTRKYANVPKHTL